MTNPNVRLQVKCAGCGRDKQEQNHWFLVKVDDRGHLHLRPMADKLTSRDQPACGQACVMKLVDRWFKK